MGSEPRAQDGTYYRACNLCEAICGLEIQVQDGQVTSIRGDAEDPLSQGHICPKAVALQDIQNDSDRLRRPVRRVGDDWQEIGWDEAFDLAAQGLRDVQAKHGHNAVAMYLGNPNVHNYGSIMSGPMLLRTLRTKHRYSATSVDQLPHQLAAWQLFGHQFLLPIPDIDHTSFFLVLGGNPAVSNGSLMTAPNVKKRLKAIRERGGKIVVVDPRRTETARLADRHHFIRPGTDAYLLMALVHTLFDEDLVALGHLEAVTQDVDKMRQIATPFTPERVAPLIGWQAEEIRGLARDFAGAESAVCYGRMGASVQEFGGLCQWLTQVINILTGNLDRRGGAMFTRPAFDSLQSMSRGNFNRWQSHVRGLPEALGELPVASMAEDMLAPEKPIRALITSAGNPVLSTPNGRQVDRALYGLDFMVSIDIYINETTRHADLILPPRAPLEHEHYDLAFHVLAVRNTARFSPAIFDPGPDARHDWQILLELAGRLAGGTLKQRAKLALGRWALGRGPEFALDMGLRRGFHGAGLLGLKKDGLTLGRLKNAPHGVDLGPLEPCLPDRLFHRDQKIRLVPELYAQDVGRLEASAEKSEANGLVLISRRHVRSCNSWMHNYPRLMRGKDRCTLLIHPEDAARLEIEDGARVRLSSRAGGVEVPAEVSDEMMPGVVCLPHGWGHHRTGIQVQTAQAHPGASVNDVTDHLAVDGLTGNAALSGVPVEVRPV